MGDSGHVIMTTADDETAKAVLDDGGYVYIEGESILAEVDDKPGGMARLSRALADAGVNIHGHLFLGAGAIGRCSRSWSTSPTSPGRSSSGRADLRPRRRRSPISGMLRAFVLVQALRSAPRFQPSDPDPNPTP